MGDNKNKSYENVVDPMSIPYKYMPEMEWYDFSTTVNPYGLPDGLVDSIKKSLDSGVLTMPVDRNCQELKNALAKFHNLEPDNFLISNTVCHLVGEIAQTFNPCTVGVSLPIFANQIVPLVNAGHYIEELDYGTNFLTNDAAGYKAAGLEFDAAMLANPSYPASRLLRKSVLLGFLNACSWVIVDESLINLTLNGESMTEFVSEYDNLVIVRSLSASFGMDGLPISYCVAHPKTIELINRHFDNSTVGMFGEVIAGFVRSDNEYFESCSERLESEIPWLYCMLNLIPDVDAFTPESNCILCHYKPNLNIPTSIPDVSTLVCKLRLAGIVVKDLSACQGLIGSNYFSVSVRTRDENLKLISALRSVLE